MLTKMIHKYTTMEHITELCSFLFLTSWIVKKFQWRFYAIFLWGDYPLLAPFEEKKTTFRRETFLVDPASQSVTTKQLK